MIFRILKMGSTVECSKDFKIEIEIIFWFFANPFQTKPFCWNVVGNKTDSARKFLKMEIVLEVLLGVGNTNIITY